MPEADQLSRLIGDIYDAALDLAPWPHVLEGAAHYAGGQAAGLLSKDSVSRIGDVHHNFGVDPHGLRLYREAYWKFDPLAPLLFCGIGEITSRTDFASDEEFREGRFHKEWAAPQGWIDAANVVLEKSATSVAIFSVIRGKASGMVDEDMRRRMRLIVPHLCRAVLIGKAVDLEAAEAAAFADTLDGLSAGVFLVDAKGRIVHVNASGRALAAEGAALRVVDDTLVPADAVAARVLDEALAAAGDGDTAVGVRGIAVPLTARDRERYTVHVLPLTSGARRCAGQRYAAVAAVVVRKAAIETPSPAEAVARSYGLTPSELRVMLASIEVGGVAETADALGIGEATVKTHLHRVFGKTGASRQADLVRLVAAFANPLVN
jgi:DNA-binding CsgD family transcriptional regulator/PAS domain-containing protein